MHMTCQKAAGGCGHEFCWLCRKNWRGHSACNRSEEIINEEMKSEQAKTELDYYMWNFHRYDSHHKALLIADKQKQNSKEKAELLSTQLGVPLKDCDFLQEATIQLLENRRVLKYSYILAFYLPRKGSLRNLFEHYQTDLESYTNILSEKYEQPTKSMLYSDFISWRQEVINFTRISKKFFFIIFLKV